MLTQMPRSDPASKDIHEQSDIDEASVESDVSYIAHPDLIRSRNLNASVFY